MKTMNIRTTVDKTRDARPLLFLYGLIASLIFSLMLIQPAFSEAFTLGTVKQGVLRDYKNVSHMETAELQNLIVNNKDVLIFDVREESEFNVSHIPGAVRVSPSSWGWTFLRDHGANVKGKTVVFYCSVGVRSSTMAARVQEGLAQRGARKIQNLNGGIFAWHNEKRALVNDNGNTPFVHPFDKHWGSLLNRQNETRMSPVN